MRLLMAGLACSALVACGQPGDDSTAATPTADPAQTPAAGGAPAALPEWLPDAVVLPDDFQTVAVRTIGSRTRLLQGTTEADADVVLQRNLESLTDAGYTVRRLETEPDLLFDGHGFEQGKIAIIDTYDGMGRIFQVDLMLASP